MTLKYQGQNNVYCIAILTERFICIRQTCKCSSVQIKTSDIKEHCKFPVMDKNSVTESTSYGKQYSYFGEYTESERLRKMKR